MRRFLGFFSSPFPPSRPFRPPEGVMARPGWRNLGAASGQLLPALLFPSFLPWDSTSHSPHPGFSCPVATTEASQVSSGDDPFTLLCSAAHPEPLERVRLAWMVLPSSSSGTIPVPQPGGSFAAVSFSVSFPTSSCKSLTDRGCVWGFGRIPRAGSAPVVEALSSATIPALPHPHPHPRAKRGHGGFSMGLSRAALTPSPSPGPGFGLSLRVNPNSFHGVNLLGLCSQRGFGAASSPPRAKCCHT